MDRWIRFYFAGSYINTCRILIIRYFWFWIFKISKDLHKIKQAPWIWPNQFQIVIW